MSDLGPFHARRPDIDTLTRPAPTRRRGPDLAALRGRFAHPRTPLVVLGLVALLSLIARVLWLENPDRSLIFDEQYYVNAARVILGLHVPAHANYAGAPLGMDPNHEHPPLGKLLIVVGMKLFGDNPLGWRFFSLVFGTLAIGLMYWLVRSAGGGRWLSVGAATLMAVDNLSLLHGRIATLDVFVVVFMLLAAALYLRGHWLLAAVALGLGISVKLYAVYLLIVLVLFELLMLRVRPDAAEADIGALRLALRARLVRLVKFVPVSLLCYLVALLAADAAVHGPLNPLLHTRDMITYGGGLKSPDGPEGIASYPWQWLLNQVPINYFTVNTDVYSGSKLVVSHPVVAFQGVMNPFIIFLALPALGLAVWLAWHERDRLSALVVAWIAGTFLPFVVLAAFFQRTEYLYYMVVIVPGIYLAVARLFSRRFLPPAATLGWVCAVGYGFWSLYPFRTWSGH
jgi:dolichyl-phosphate-mannose-protein mannosyltransferase